MNCHEAEQDLLLEQSGELSAALKARLGLHLESCATCRARRDEWSRLTAMVQSTTTTCTPSAAVMERILAAAADASAKPRPIIRPLWKSTLAAAAGLALLLGGVGLLHGLRPTPGGTSAMAGESRLAEVSSLLAMIMEHEDPLGDSSRKTAPDVTQECARQLLILEGLDVEAAEEPSAEATRLEERQPTTLQWRNSPESPSGICV